MPGLFVVLCTEYLTGIRIQFAENELCADGVERRLCPVRTVTGMNLAAHSFLRVLFAEPDAG